MNLTPVNYGKAFMAFVCIAAAGIEFYIGTQDIDKLRDAIHNKGKLSTAGYALGTCLDYALGTCFLLLGMMLFMTWY